MKEIGEIRSVYFDMRKLLEFHGKHPERLEEYQRLRKNSDIDKYGFGFVKDDRFSAVGRHTVTFDSWEGFFGSSNCSSLLSISNRDLFWQAFDKYLNQHQEEIFQYIATEFKKELGNRMSEVDDAISSLMKLKEVIGGEKGGDE